MDLKANTKKNKKSGANQCNHTPTNASTVRSWKACFAAGCRLKKLFVFYANKKTFEEHKSYKCKKNGNQKANDSNYLIRVRKTEITDKKARN